MSDQEPSRLRWSYLSTAVQAGMQLVAAATITRFLQPSDYGLAALASLCYSLAFYFTQLGTNRAIMQKPDLNAGNIRAAFTLSLLTGAGGTLLIAVLAPALAHYFHEPRLKYVLFAFAPNMLFYAAGMVSGGLLRREYRMRDLALCDLLGYALSTFGVGLPMAIKGYGIWALVGSNVSQPLIVAIAYYLARRHPLTPTFRRANYAQIGGFSGKASLTTCIEAFGGMMDTMVMGKLISPAALGIYNRSLTLSTQPGYNVSMGLTRVFYPTLARAAETGKRECFRLLVRSERELTAIVLPFCAGAATTAATLIPVLFGRQWSSAIPVYRMLCLVAALDATFHLPSIQLEILSLFRHKFLLQTGFALLFGLGIYFVVPWKGVFGVAIVFAVLQGVRTLGMHWLSARSLDVSPFSLFATWTPGLVCSALVSGILYGAQRGLDAAPHLALGMKFAILILIAFVSAIAIYRILFRESVYDPWMKLFRRRGVSAVLPPGHVAVDPGEPGVALNPTAMTEEEGRL